MSLKTLRDEVWKVLDEVKNAADKSQCDESVLYKAALELAPAIRLLALKCNEPPANHNAEFYRKWLVEAAHGVFHYLYWWEIADGSMTQAKPEFSKILVRIRDCSPELGESDHPQVRPVAAVG